MCEGALCIRRALENGFAMPTLLTTQAQLDGLGALVPPETEVIVADNAQLQAVTGFKFHRGCLATVMKRPLGAPDFAGSKRVVFAEAVSNPAFGANWFVVKDWSEQARYNTASHQKAKKLYNAITDKTNGVMPWIRNRW